MLHRFETNLPQFQPIEFGVGFNIVIAARDPEATNQNSRNARGKTTLIQAINYCLGGTLAAPLKPLAERDRVFSLWMELFGGLVVVSRDLKRGSRVRLQGDPDVLNELRTFLDDSQTLSVEDWKFLLGLGLFNLDESASAENDFALSPRTLLSYVVRTVALSDPFKILPAQPAWSSRAHMAYLLGLDWSLVRSLARVKRKTEAYDAIRYASEHSLLPNSYQSESELMIRRTELQHELDSVDRRARSFQVIEDTDGLISRADEITEELRELRNQSVVDRRLIDLYESSIAETGGSDFDADVLRRLYAEMRVAFSPETLTELSDVTAFHQAIVLNRRRFLEDELSSIKVRETQRTALIQSLSSRRESLMAALASGGALEELVNLQAEVAELKAQISEVESALTSIREISQAKESARAERAQLRSEASQGVEANRPNLDRMAGRFDEMVRSLYGVSGVLTVEVDDLGYKFGLKVARSASSGVSRMQQFCFDLALLQEGTDMRRHPGFLVHDSVVFDGVDPRQVDTALNLARSIAEDRHAQYICTLNSNDLSPELQASKWFQEGICRTVMDTDDGGIFGEAF